MAAYSQVLYIKTLTAAASHIKEDDPIEVYWISPTSPTLHEICTRAYRLEGGGLHLLVVTLFSVDEVGVKGGVH